MTHIFGEVGHTHGPAAAIFDQIESLLLALPHLRGTMFNTRDDHGTNRWNQCLLHLHDQFAVTSFMRLKSPHANASSEVGAEEL